MTVQRTSAVTSIVEALKHEITRSHQPGDLLPTERLLAERFDVGRNTIREAIIILETYGFIKKTQRGPRVAEPGFEPLFQNMEHFLDRSAETYRDLLEFRRYIEIGVLPAVVERIDDDQLEALERALVAMDRALTASEAAEADYAFHYAIVSASGNAVVTKMYKVMSRTLVYYMEIGKADPAIGQDTTQYHRDMVTAFRERSLEKALAAVNAHFAYSEFVLNKETAN